jgi:hypothetical protein
MKDDILRFDIPMDDPVRMYFPHRVADLSHEPGHIFFRHRGLLFKLMEELSTSTHFHDQIYGLGVIEKPEKFHDISVVEEHLNLNFSDELLGDLLLDQQFLLYAF